MRGKNKPPKYLDAGYINIDYVENMPASMYLMIAGRGIGKTFGIIQWCIEHGKKLLFLRRTRAQLDLAVSVDFGIHLPLNRTFGYNLGFVPVPRSGGNFYYLGEVEEVEGKTGKKTLKLVGDYVGIAGSLTAVENARGIDLTDFDRVCLDEFIRSPGELPKKGEFETWLNLVATVSRLREQQGRPLPKYYMTANSFMFNNPYFRGFGYMDKIVNMKREGKDEWIDHKHLRAILMFEDSPVLDSMKTTQLAKMLQGTVMQGVIFENDFKLSDMRNIKSRPLIEYVPIVSIGEITVYHHKSRTELYYVSLHKQGQPKTIPADDTGLKQFQGFYQYFWYAFLQNRIEFETVSCRYILLSYLNKNIDV